MKVGPKRINPDLYKKIIRVLPIPCVDAVVVCGRSFLLDKRTNKPAQGQWFVIGGRVLKGESLQNAVRRHVTAETGMTDFKIKKLLTTAATIFNDSAQGPSSHTINSVFLVEAPSKKLRVAEENETLQWFSEIHKSWHPYVKNVLRIAGFRDDNLKQ